MRYSGPEADGARTQILRAAVYIDYENLYGAFFHRVSQRDHPDELINEVLEELRRYLMDEFHTQAALSRAYADFADLRGNGQFIQRALYMQGIETRFVPSTLQRNAAEIQLCIDAMDDLYNRSDIRSFVFVTGDRPYLPLIQQIKRNGGQVLVVTLQPPASTTNLQYIEDDIFLNAVNLLSEPSKRAITSDTSSARPRNGFQAPATPRQAPERPEPVTYHPLESVGAQQTLEIIQEHFGQYEEVYLTPLLRKLSEMLDENHYDPKSLISELEDAGVVWLEKRRGFPYDYTVLLVDSNHPDVKESEKKYDDVATGDYEDDEYDDVYDGYDDDAYDRYDDEYEDEAYEDEEAD